MNIRWSNIPIPLQHSVGIVAAMILRNFYPLRIIDRSWLGHALGWPVILVAVLLASWATVEAGAANVNVEFPSKVIATGPYAFSRNPMYLAWTAIVLGAAMVANTWWLFFLLPLIALQIHFVDVLREEDFLERQFGEEYRRYRDRVRRYF
jgi:protein-S-isoprenylcysteine O-methyltransferase Ste14